MGAQKGPVRDILGKKTFLQFNFAGCKHQTEIGQKKLQWNIVVLSRDFISFSLCGNSRPPAFWGSGFWFHRGDGEMISTALSSELAATEKNLLVMWLHDMGLNLGFKIPAPA